MTARASRIMGASERMLFRNKREIEMKLTFEGNDLKKVVRIF